jgi:hypothetical protein
MGQYEDYEASLLVTRNPVKNNYIIYLGRQASRSLEEEGLGQWRGSICISVPSIQIVES